MYAMVEIKGKQYKAEKGAVLKVDKIDGEKGDAVDFDSVLLLNDEKNVKVGTPYVDGVTIKTTIEEHKKDKKVVIFKFKRRKGYRRKQGHRETYSYLKVNEITGA